MGIEKKIKDLEMKMLPFKELFMNTKETKNEDHESIDIKDINEKWYK